MTKCIDFAVNVIAFSDNKAKRGWPKDRPHYCKFVMYKENIDTIEACNLIARYMKYVRY